MSWNHFQQLVSKCPLCHKNKLKHNIHTSISFSIYNIDTKQSRFCWLEVTEKILKSGKLLKIRGPSVGNQNPKNLLSISDACIKVSRFTDDIKQHLEATLTKVLYRNISFLFPIYTHILQSISPEDSMSLQVPFVDMLLIAPSASFKYTQNSRSETPNALVAPDRS